MEINKFAVLLLTFCTAHVFFENDNLIDENVGVEHCFYKMFPKITI